MSGPTSLEAFLHGKHTHNCVFTKQKYSFLCNSTPADLRKIDQKEQEQLIRTITYSEKSHMLGASKNDSQSLGMDCRF